MEIPYATPCSIYEHTKQVLDARGLEIRALGMMAEAVHGVGQAAKEGAAEMRELGQALQKLGDRPMTRRTRSGRRIYGLHPKTGPRFWTARADDKLERRRVRSRIAHAVREDIGPAPAPYRMTAAMAPIRHLERVR